MDGLLREGIPSGRCESLPINLKDKRSNWNASFSQPNWLVRLDAMDSRAEAPYETGQNEYNTGSCYLT